MGERANRHNRLESLALRVARLNEDYLEVGPGMLASLIADARELAPNWSALPPSTDPLVEEYAAMSPAQIIEELLAHEGAEGFSHGLADRADQVINELRAAERSL